MLIVIVVIAALVLSFILGCIIYAALAFSSKNVYKKTSEQLGKEGEKQVAYVLGGTVDGVQYLVNDIIITDKKGKSSQIDHVFINKFGIWVIETKNYAGYIYGNEKQREWVQVLAYGQKKNNFYNPVKQNLTHIYRLKWKIGRFAPLHNVVVFPKADISNVKSSCVHSLNGLKKIVWICENERLTQEQMKKYYDKLIYLRDNNTVSAEEHVEKIEKMREDIANGICPDCGCKIVLRKGKYGDFYGCSNFPKCRFKYKI